MKTNLDHLPEGKRAELAHVVKVIREGFAFATARRTQPHLRSAKLLKIILFGSYARGDWVEDPVGRYFSDFDMLVVVNHEDLTDVAEFWEKTESQLTTDLSEGVHLRTLASPIFHSLEDVNEKLRLGRYFFMDIIQDGIALFEEPGHEFVEPQPLSPEQALQETREYFEEWFESAENFLSLSMTAQRGGMLKESAFLLHQAAERFYHCLFLVRTLYSPKTHNLNRLRDMAEELEPTLRAVWLRESRFQKRCYSLLRDAYVKARYSRSFVISAEELDWTAGRVALLRDCVRKACEIRINDLALAV
jgi:predicted nucleotidyltransferase/HEPN domain-containing protein